MPPASPGVAERRALDAGHGDLDSLLAAHGLVLSAHLLRPWDHAEDAGGAPVEEIAARAHLSPGTVRNHLSAVIGKTGTDTRYEAVRQARDNGWL